MFNACGKTCVQGKRERIGAGCFAMRYAANALFLYNKQEKKLKNRCFMRLLIDFGFLNVKIINVIRMTRRRYKNG